MAGGMTRWETYLALLAVVLASLSVVNLGGRPRSVLAFAAIALLFVVGYARLRRQVTSAKKSASSFDAYERALRIQEERDRKFHGR
jgi:membrane protein implicated in regulation of membrane protease activity